MSSADIEKNLATRQPKHVSSAEGVTSWLHGDIYTLKLAHADTDGSFSLIEASVPPGGGPPLHIHKKEDEIFYILSGELDVTAGDNIYNAKPGDLVVIPKGVPHRFKNNGLHTARQLLLFNPAGFEGFFVEAGSPAIPGVMPPAFDPQNNERVIDIGIKYQAEQLPNPDLERTL